MRAHDEIHPFARARARAFGTIHDGVTCAQPAQAGSVLKFAAASFRRSDSIRRERHSFVNGTSPTLPITAWAIDGVVLS